ncbi:MAG: hypothetical protein SFX72_10150 [Isosphaeraceae bacterium]|nr:hypothetical protein [Isosphaeraceae bacterium]
MTFVGKILVILIMATSLVFLGVATVTFTTATNWKEETKKQQDAVGKLRTEIQTVQAEFETLKAKLDAAAKDHEAEVKKLQGNLAAREVDLTTATAEITAARKALTDAEANARVALEDSAARRKETEQIREIYSGVQKQANDYKLQQLELNDQIRELKRMLDVADRNAKDLREKLLKTTGYIQEKIGVVPSFDTLKAVELPPNVEGVVTRLDGTGRKMEISIGSDDGLAVGQEFYVFRTEPAEYLGKVKITAVDPDQATAGVIGNTVNGKKIREGDRVASTLHSK